MTAFLLTLLLACTGATDTPVETQDTAVDTDTDTAPVDTSDTGPDTDTPPMGPAPAWVDTVAFTASPGRILGGAPSIVVHGGGASRTLHWVYADKPSEGDQDWALQHRVQVGDTLGEERTLAEAADGTVQSELPLPSLALDGTTLHATYRKATARFDEYGEVIHHLEHLTVTGDALTRQPVHPTVRDFDQGASHLLQTPNGWAVGYRVRFYNWSLDEVYTTTASPDFVWSDVVHNPDGFEDYDQDHAWLAYRQNRLFVAAEYERELLEPHQVGVYVEYLDSFVPVSLPGEHAQYPSLAVDRDEQLILAWGGGQCLRLATCRAGSCAVAGNWTREQVACDTDGVPVDPVVAPTPDGHRWVIFEYRDSLIPSPDTDRYQVFAANDCTGEWSVDALSLPDHDSRIRLAKMPLAVDADGTLHAAFLDHTDGTMHWLTNAGCPDPVP